MTVMRRLLVPLIGSMLLLAACGGSGGAGSTAATSAASAPAASSPATESMAAASMSEHMTESMAPSAGAAADDMHSSMTEDMHSSMAESMTESAADPMTGSMTDPATTGVSITTASSTFGDILFDGNRQAIYLFDKETTTTPDCYGDCAAAWPPVLTTGSPVAAGGINAALLGTTTRSDGSTQVTYANHPLYYYAGEGPGEVTCHNVREFGGLWLVVTPAGEAAAA